MPLIFSPVAGSFLGVVIRRLPEGRPIVFARSCCDACGHVLGAPDLVPLASHLAFRGRCRHCAAPVSPFHPAVEVSAIGVAAAAVLAAPFDPVRLWAGCALGWALLVLAWIDWDHFLLPDVITLPLIPAGLAFTALRLPEALTDHALGAALGYAAFAGIARLYRALRGRDGLGAGDAKLLAAAGAWLGWAALPGLVLLAALLGLGLSGARAVRRGHLDPAERLPFGSCLALAAWAVWLGGVP